jgi:hypothetical protein
MLLVSFVSIPQSDHILCSKMSMENIPLKSATSFRPSRGAQQGVSSLEGAAWLIRIQTEKGIQKPGSKYIWYILIHNGMIIFWHQNYQFWFKNIPSINI